MNNYKRIMDRLNKAIVASNSGNAQVNELTEQARKLARRIEKMFIKEMKRTSTDNNDSHATNVKAAKEMARGVKEILTEYVKKHPIKLEDFANHCKKMKDYLWDVTYEFFEEGVSAYYLDHMDSGVTECVLVRSRAKELSKQANELAHILD